MIARLQKWLARRGGRGKGRAAPPTSAPITYTRLTLDDWRSSPERVFYVAELLRNDLFRELVAMLANVRPLHRGPLDPTTAALLLGQRTGHDQVIASLLAAATSLDTKPVEDVPADYGADNVQALWESEADA